VHIVAFLGVCAWRGDVFDVSSAGEPGPCEALVLAAGRRVQENPMSAATVGFDLADLLARAGARIRGRRADCPHCGGKRTVSYTEEVFYCHHAGCDFRGNTFTLAKELGLARRLPKAEYLARKRDCGRERRAAEALAEQVNARRRLLATAERTMHKALAVASAAGRENPENPAVWDVMAAVYRQLPNVRAEWVLLSYGPALAVTEFLSASPRVQGEMLGAVIVRGGVFDDGGRFVEIPTLRR